MILHTQAAGSLIIGVVDGDVEQLCLNQRFSDRYVNLFHIQGVAIRQGHMVNGEQGVGVVVVVPSRTFLGKEIGEITHRLCQKTCMDAQDEDTVLTQKMLQLVGRLSRSWAVDATRSCKVLDKHRLIATSGLIGLVRIVDVDFVAAHREEHQGRSCKYQ